MITNEGGRLFKQGSLRVEVRQLQLLAFLQVARAYADRVQMLDTMDNSLDLVMIDFRLV